LALKLTIKRFKTPQHPHKLTKLLQKLLILAHIIATICPKHSNYLLRAYYPFAGAKSKLLRDKK